MPQIEKIKDRSIVKQSIDSLNLLDSKISEISEEPEGSIRIVFLGLSKGRIEINSKDNKITYVLENTRLELSEPDEKIKEGKLIIETKKYGERFNIFLTLDYNKTIDLSFEENEINKTLQSGPNPYKIKIENLGYNIDEKKIRVNLNTL